MQLAKILRHSWHLLVQSQQWKHQKNVGNLLKVINKSHQNDDVVLVLLLITFNRSPTFFWCFHCWIWTSKCRLGKCLKDYQDLEVIIKIINVIKKFFQFSFWRNFFLPTKGKITHASFKYIKVKCIQDDVN